MLRLTEDAGLPKEFGIVPTISQPETRRGSHDRPKYHHGRSPSCTPAGRPTG